MAVESAGNVFLKMAHSADRLILMAKRFKFSQTPSTSHSHSCLRALQQLQLDSKVPELSEYLKQDLSLWTSYYFPAKNILQERWQEEIWNNISNFLHPMKQPYPIESVHYFEGLDN